MTCHKMIYRFAQKYYILWCSTNLTTVHHFAECMIFTDFDFIAVWSLSCCVLQKKAVGVDLYEQVFYSLDLIEKDYFGLQYTDANNVQVRTQRCKHLIAP